MELKYYHIDAFTSRVFAGNPAGVCFLDRRLEDDVLQAIASENRLSETAFLIEAVSGYGLRWFTPKVEIDLCGHATLASAHAVFKYARPDAQEVEFDTMSGRLGVKRSGDLLVMDFPSRPPVQCEECDMDKLADIMGSAPSHALRSRDLVLVYETEEQVKALSPNMDGISSLDFFGVIATAPGGDCDFVSRFFAPRAGIPEDPVTGSAHSTLIPYWAARLGKKEMQAHQVSSRGGELYCTDNGRRVSIGGRAVTYLEGKIIL